METQLADLLQLKRQRSSSKVKSYAGPDLSNRKGSTADKMHINDAKKALELSLALEKHIASQQDLLHNEIEALDVGKVSWLVHFTGMATKRVFDVFCSHQHEILPKLVLDREPNSNGKCLKLEVIQNLLKRKINLPNKCPQQDALLSLPAESVTCRQMKERFRFRTETCANIRRTFGHTPPRKGLLH